MTRDRGEARARPAAAGQAPQQVLDVRLVAGALAPEHVGVDGRRAASRELPVDGRGRLGARAPREAARALRPERAPARRGGRSPRAMPAAIASAFVRIDEHGGAVGDLRHRRVARSSRRARRTRAPRARGCRSPRRATGTRRRARRGRGDASSSSGTKPRKRTPSPFTRDVAPAARAGDAQLDARARAPPRASRGRFLRGSTVPTASTYSPSARAPSATNGSPTAFGTTRIALLRDAEQLDQLALRELGDGDHALAPHARRAARRGGCTSRVQRLNASGMPQDGEVVHGDDERHARRQRRRGSSGSAARRRSARAAAARADTTRRRARPSPPCASRPTRAARRRRAARGRGSSAAQVARRAGARLAKRRDVDGDAHRLKVSQPRPRTPRASASPIARAVKRDACARPATRRARPAARAPRRSPPRSPRRSSGSARTAASPHASSSDGVRGRDDRHAARHRLEHGNPEALEARRIDEDATRRDRGARARRRRRSRGGSRRAGRDAAAGPSPRRRRRRARARRRATRARRAASRGSSAARASRRSARTAVRGRRARPRA